jgi:hypothetical protein
MWRGRPLNSKSLRDLSAELENYGYHSVLLPFHSESSDYLIKSAAALIPGNKLKYMIALRPYHISPQFCAMVTEGYNQIDPDRLIFNWIAGNFDERKDEGPQFDVLGNTEEIDTMIKRTTFLRNFIKQYNSFSVLTKKPEMIFSGFSDYTIETAKMYNGTSLCMIDDYRNNLNKFKEIEKIMICVNPIILESNDEVKEYRKKIYSVNPRSIETTIIGNRQRVKEKLLNLKNEKITDILLYTNMPNFPGLSHDANKVNDILVNELVKEINQGRE